MRKALVLTALLATAPQITFAEEQGCAVAMQFDFFEGAPVDRFVVTNVSNSNIGPLEIQFDLRPSRGKLVFDTQSGGAGVKVFQPFQSASTTLDVADGAEALRMPLSELAAGGTVSFTIDVDDRQTDSERGQIRVSGSEMQGTVVTVLLNATSYSGAFDADNSAVIEFGCANKV